MKRKKALETIAKLRQSGRHELAKKLQQKIGVKAKSLSVKKFYTPSTSKTLDKAAKLLNAELKLKGEGFMGDGIFDGLELAALIMNGLKKTDKWEIN